METKTLGALIFAALIIGANALMYGFVRAWTKPGKANFLETLGQSLTRRKADDMDELRRKLEELKKNGSGENKRPGN